MNKSGEAVDPRKMSPSPSQSCWKKKKEKVHEVVSKLWSGFIFTISLLI